ncbi:MAG: sialate O-acetylesterase [Bacteroidota bacterium]|nr:sialate O-acetylesterase [Bacteroidota bacterium]
MRNIVLIISLFSIITGGFSQSKVSENKLMKHPEKVWVFILAGQSNMAGRGKVEAQDTVASPRVLSINAKGEIVLAREPLNFYETKMQGTGCGLAFGKELLNNIPKDISVLILQTAVGGSSINQWIKNSIHREVQLLSNFKEKVELGKRYGTIKAILWHQGETDAKPDGIQQRQENLKTLFGMFRNAVGNDSLPILIGELGSYSKTPELFARMNEQTRLYSVSDCFTSVIATADFQHRGDFLHFNSAGQREMGKRFAREYVRKFMTK